MNYVKNLWKGGKKKGEPDVEFNHPPKRAHGEPSTSGATPKYSKAGGGGVTSVGGNLPVYGIDIGNQNSYAAVAQGGGFECVMNEQSNRNTPSIVSFQNSERLIGSTANENMLRNWKNTVRCAKRLVGLAPEEAKQELRYVTCDIQKSTLGGIQLAVTFNNTEYHFRPEDIYASIVYALYTFVMAAVARSSSPRKSLDCVLAVPVWYNSRQRELVLQAARQLAGVNCLGLINETTAAALEHAAYKVSSLRENIGWGTVCVAFVDIGESGTTMSVVLYNDKQVKVLGHTYDANLGGRDFDNILFEHFVGKIKSQYGCEILGNPKSTQKLLRSCEKLKKMLSTNAVGALECELAEYDISFGAIQRDWFDELCAPLLSRITNLAKQLLALPLVSCNKKSLHSVEVFGGGTRIPSVKTCLTNAFEMQVQTTLNTDECVARGSGVAAAQLSPATRGQVRRFEIFDHFAAPVQLGWSDPTAKSTDAPPLTLHTPEGPTLNMFLPLFTETDIFPASRLPSLTVPAPTAVVYLLQRNSPNPLGAWKITKPKNPPPGGGVRHTPKPSAKGKHSAKHAKQSHGQQVTPAPLHPPTDNTKMVARVKVEVDQSGIIHLMGEAGFVVAPLMTGEEELKQAVEREHKLREENAKHHKAMESKNSLEAYILDVTRSLSPGEPFCKYKSEDEINAFRAALQEAEDWLYGDGAAASFEDYSARLDALKGTEKQINEYNKECSAIEGLAVQAEKLLNNLTPAQAQNTTATETLAGYVKAVYSDIHGRQKPSVAADDITLLLKELTSAPE
eukprot:TRINITY_DN46334_c0_g1_i1.p1 TRINITY_DN46334_c0_g1~~TRINITY_DN46334_c0_g1_i1.p1  ORF type:complete len:791 (+),score=72.26 TRINITY_DN46334_c0_g1_i1:60-2432(+)